MRKFLSLMVLLIQSGLYAQTYYDAENREIDKQTFDKLLLDPKYESVANDSLNRFKLFNFRERSEVGKLGDVENLYKELNERLNMQLATNKPLIIYYYPGKDPCNSGGVFVKRKELLKWDKELSQKIQKVADVNVLRIYKDSEGIKTLKDHDWRKDPNALIENLFFNYHYGCGSFVIIDKERYVASFGEYGHKEVVASLRYLLEQ